MSDPLITISTQDIIKLSAVIVLITLEYRNLVDQLSLLTEADLQLGETL